MEIFGIIYFCIAAGCNAGVALKPFDSVEACRKEIVKTHAALVAGPYKKWFHQKEYNTGFGCLSADKGKYKPAQHSPDAAMCKILGPLKYKQATGRNSTGGCKQADAMNMKVLTHFDLADELKKKK